MNDQNNYIARAYHNDDIFKKVVRSEKEAYDLYNEYAYKIGFSVRKGTTRYYSGTKLIRQKEYYCSKKGYKEDPSPCESTQYTRLDVRTGCKAMIRFTVDEDGIWSVTCFYDEHNHELASEEEKHLLRSGRKMTESKAIVIKTMVNSGIKTNQAFNYMVGVAGGVENVGIVKKDCYNLVNKEKLSHIEGGDAQSLSQWFKKQRTNDMLFFHDVQLNQVGQMTNFFWCDGRSRVDYDYFGDVVIFDTTYKTNRYNLICAPFVGVNHHWQNVMFGCALLSDETIPSFVWLFKTFLEAMGNKAPQTIFTDQDGAMAAAIQEVFPGTAHRLCQWHISKNAPSHLGSLGSNSDFRHLFEKCMKWCDTEKEFEECWSRMMKEHDCEKYSWLDRMYKIREKWSNAFTKGTFTCDILSSQRSESTNSVLNELANRTTSLCNFVLQLEKLVKSWRDNEAEKDFHCKNGTISLKVRGSSICHHASTVYTHVIFKLFEKNFLDGVAALNSVKISTNESLHSYEVVKDMGSTKSYIVQFDSSTLDISCTCKKFESMGLLCSHSLHCLVQNKVKCIPEKYILRRWTKNAKMRKCKLDQGESSHSRENGSSLEYSHRMMRKAYDMVVKSQMEENARKLIENAFDRLGNELDNLVLNLDLDDQDTRVGSRAFHSNVEEDQHVDEEPILDPPIARTKGASSMRLKSHFEKRKKKPKEASTSRKSKQSLGKNSETNAISVDVGNYQQGYHYMQMAPNNYMNPYFQQMQMANLHMPFTSMMQGIQHFTNPNVVPSNHEDEAQHFTVMNNDTMPFQEE